VSLTTAVRPHRSGTIETFFGAGGPHPDAAARAAQEVGSRGVVAQWTLDVAFNIPESMQLTTIWP
jgi:hypothetical protein